MIELAHIKEFDLFRHVTLDNIQSISNEAEYLELDANETLFTEGSVGRDIFLIISGAVSILNSVPGGESSELKELHVLREGEVLGELSYVDNAPRSAGAQTKEKSVLLQIPADALDSLCEEKPLLGYRLMKNLAQIITERIRTTNLELRNSMIWG